MRAREKIRMPSAKNLQDKSVDSETNGSANYVQFAIANRSQRLAGTAILKARNHVPISKHHSSRDMSMRKGDKMLGRRSRASSGRIGEYRLIDWTVAEVAAHGEPWLISPHRHARFQAGSLQKNKVDIAET